MNELVGAVLGWPTFVVALIAFGFAPGMLLAAILRLFHSDDPRREELHAELYAVPRWERPFWVLQQFEVALREGFGPRVSWRWHRHVWHRSKIESGLSMHRQYPDSFWVPSDEDKAELRPGDGVKLLWKVRGLPGERMWVTITHRKGDKLIGRLDNWAMFVYLHPGAKVKFSIDDIIDFHWEEDRGTEPDDGSPGVAVYHADCNGADAVSG